MASFKAKIIDPVGIHARPASVVVKEASKYTADIKIKSGDKTGNLKSIMNVMALGISNGTEIEIIADGVDAEAAITGLKKVMQENQLI